MTKQAKKSTKKIVESVGILENANMVHALAYLPYFIGPIAMYFLGKSNKKATMHHIKYAILMAIGVVVLYLLLNDFFSKIISLVYIVASAIFAYKAYMGENVKVEIFDTIEGKISEKIKK